MKIATAIAEQGVHYALALKGSRGKLHGQVGEFFKLAEQSGYNALDAKPGKTCEHGHIELRWIVALPSIHMERIDAWIGLKSMIMVEAIREIGEKCSSKHRLHVTFLEPDSTQMGNAIRAHWASQIAC